MRKHLYLVIISATILLLYSSCAQTYNNVYKTDDYSYKYEQAKQYYAEGKYSQCSLLLDQMILVMKGTETAEESLFMTAMCYYKMHDYSTSIVYFERYYKSYPRGRYTELARLYCGKASYMESPDPALDQTPTVNAMKELQTFLEQYPYSPHKEEVTQLLFELQDRMVQKEYNAAKLYYNLGNYVGNCVNGGSNFEACIITAENALKTYPYTSLREDLYIMILRSRFHLASNSVENKSEDRYRMVIDEYYGFKNEFPDSKYMAEANDICDKSENQIKKIKRYGLQED